MIKILIYYNYYVCFTFNEIPAKSEEFEIFAEKRLSWCPATTTDAI